MSIYSPHAVSRKKATTIAKHLRNSVYSKIGDIHGHFIENALARTNSQLQINKY